MPIEEQVALMREAVIVLIGQLSNPSSWSAENIRRLDEIADKLRALS